MDMKVKFCIGILLLFGIVLNMSVIPIFAQVPIQDSLHFSEEELQMIKQQQSNVVKDNAEVGKTVSFGLEFRVFTSFGKENVMGHFANGETPQELLNGIDKEGRLWNLLESDMENFPSTSVMLSIPMYMIHIESNGEWVVSDHKHIPNDLSVRSSARFFGEFLMFSVEEAIAEKNLTVDLETLELQEVYFFDEQGYNYKDVLYGFLYTNQGNYVYYQDSIYDDRYYIFTETEFYEFISKEYARRQHFDPTTDGFSYISPNDMESDVNEPSMPNKFDYRHLFWMIPTGVLVLTAGIGIPVWLTKRKRKSVQE